MLSVYLLQDNVPRCLKTLGLSFEGLNNRNKGLWALQFDLHMYSMPTLEDHGLTTEIF